MKRVAHCCLSLAVALTLTAAAGLVHSGVGTPPVIVLSAFVPALGYSVLLAWIGRRSRRATHVILATFVCGGLIAAILSTTANDLFQLWLVRVLGASDANRWTPLFGAPVIEEVSKTVALLVFLAYVRGTLTVLDGILHGALVGIGFAMTENIDYFILAAVQGGMPGLARSVYLRGCIEGLNHATFTASVGAAIGYARLVSSAGASVAVASIGLVAAVLQHIVWNALASRAVMDALCDPQVAGGPCRDTPDFVALFAIAPLIVALSVGPGLVALVLIGVRTSRRSAAGRATARAPDED
jgi:RsiW-degrading membrane proteinase PrsW (M82 family)